MAISREPRQAQPLEQFRRATDSIEITTEILVKHADVATTDIRRSEMLRSLRESSARLQTAIGKLEGKR